MTLYACPAISALDPLDPAYDSDGHEIADTSSAPTCSCGQVMEEASSAWRRYAEPRDFSTPAEEPSE